MYVEAGTRAGLPHRAEPDCGIARTHLPPPPPLPPSRAEARGPSRYEPMAAVMVGMKNHPVILAVTAFHPAGYRAEGYRQTTTS